MAKELKDIGEEYRKASQDSFASVIRSVGEIQGFPGHCFGNEPNNRRGQWDRRLNFKLASPRKRTIPTFRNSRNWGR